MVISPVICREQNRLLQERYQHARTQCGEIRSAFEHISVIQSGAEDSPWVQANTLRVYRHLYRSALGAHKGCVQTAGGNPECLNQALKMYQFLPLILIKAIEYEENLRLAVKVAPTVLVHAGSSTKLFRQDRGDNIRSKNC